MSNPLFPDVPNVLGVPPVLRNIKAAIGSVAASAKNIVLGGAQSAITGTISNVQEDASGELINGDFGQPPIAMTSDSPEVKNIVTAGQTQWGLFNSSGSVLELEPDSFVSLNYKNGWRIANYPMEKGAFQSYNKVSTPFDMTMVCTKGGSDAARGDFLDRINELAYSIDLFTLVTPEINYENVSIADIDYQRTAIKGVKLLTVDIKLVEIRIVADAQFTNTASASGADNVNGGTVQAVPITDESQTTEDIDTQEIEPVSSAQAISGYVPAPLSIAPQNSIPPAALSAITSAITPAVAATNPSFDSFLRSAVGKLVTPTGINALTGAAITQYGHFVVNKLTGKVVQYAANGLLAIAQPSRKIIQ
jgi:hypothetical protein